MPNYKNAADVRAQHPGVYDDLTDQQIEQGLARSAAPTPADDGALGERYHPNSADTPDSAFLGELARTGKEAGIGMLRGIPDTVSSLYNTVRHPLDTLVGLGHAIANPTETVMNLARSPRDAGSLLTQMLLTPKVPGAANTALAEGPSIAGRAISAVGRGAEAVGTSKALRRATPLGSFGTAMAGHPGMAALELAAPPALEYGGKGLQKLGGSLEGLDLSLKENPFKWAPVAEVTDPEADTVREAVRTAREAEARGASRKKAAAQGGWPLGKSAEVPYAAEPATPNTDLFPYQKDSLQGLRDAAETKKITDSIQRLADQFGERQRAAAAAKDNAWMSDKSAAVDAPLDSRITGLSPIEEFYKNDPQARIGGEGRMTGQFKEGEGGLADLAAGRLARYDAPPGTKPLFTHEGFLKDLQGSVDAGAAPAQPSPLDELSRLSGRALAPDEIQKLLDRFKGWEPE